MFSTGAIGLWSIIELGIGIIAGSLPALRPLLNLPIFGRSSAADSNATPAYSASKNSKRSRSAHRHMGSGVKMDTLLRVDSTDGAEGEIEAEAEKYLWNG